jgi:hypothetical protein
MGVMAVYLFLVNQINGFCVAKSSFTCPIGADFTRDAREFHPPTADFTHAVCVHTAWISL